jgi:hypothetical protein
MPADTWRDRKACVGRMQTTAIAWLSEVQAAVGFDSGWSATRDPRDQSAA